MKSTQPDAAVLLVTKAEAARRLSVSVSSIERAMRRGDIRTVRIGGTVRIPVSELECIARPPAQVEYRFLRPLTK